MEWLSHNIGSAVTVVVVTIGTIATWVLYGARITQLEKDIERVTTVIEELEKIVREHQTDTTVHIDPHRDEKKWDDLKSEIFRRFDGVDGKIDKLMISFPTKPSY